MNRSFSAPNRAPFQTAQRMQAPLGRTAAAAPAAPQPPACCGSSTYALARADAILRQHGQRDIVDPELEPLDPDINDPDPLYDIEPEDPSHDSSLARQNGDEEDEDEDDEEPEPEDEPAGSANPQGRQGEGKDIDITIIDVDEEHELEPDDEERPV